MLLLTRSGFVRFLFAITMFAASFAADPESARAEVTAFKQAVAEAAAALFSAASASASFFRRSPGVFRASCASARVARARASAAARFSASRRASTSARRRRSARSGDGLRARPGEPRSARSSSACAAASLLRSALSSRACSMTLRWSRSITSSGSPSRLLIATVAPSMVAAVRVRRWRRRRCVGGRRCAARPPQRLQNRVSVGAFITVDRPLCLGLLSFLYRPGRTRPGRKPRCETSLLACTLAKPSSQALCRLLDECAQLPG